MKPLLNSNGLDLVRGDTLGKHGIEIKGRSYGLRRISSISSNHYNSRHASAAKRLHGARRFAPQFVRQKDRADQAPVDGDKDTQRRSPRCAPECAQPKRADEPAPHTSW